MMMKWIYSEKSFGANPKWWHTYVNVERLEWKDAKKGDVVFIQGDFVEGVPTAMYGRHTVIDPKKQILKNAKEREFYDREYLFKEIT